MQPRSHAALAVFFGSLIGLALVVSQFAAKPSAITGQVIHNSAAGNAGFVIEPNTHVYFSCANDSPLLSPEIGDGSADAFWMYEFTGNEPPWDGRFYISKPMLTNAQINPAYSTLQTVLAGNTYYATSDVPLHFRCGEGMRAQAVCGNGLTEDNEECDSVNGCSDTCTAQTGYNCDSITNTCTILIPTLSSSSSNTSSSSSSATTSASTSSSSSQQSPSGSSATSAPTSSSQRSFSVTSEQPTNAPLVEFDKFEMEYGTVPGSNTLKAGEAFTLELRLKNTANAPRKFQIVHNTGVTDAITTAPYTISTATLRQREHYITANTRNQDTACSTKPGPYFGRWRTFCEYILEAGEERTVEYAFAVEQDFDCASSLFADASLTTNVGFYTKPYNRYARVFPEHCGFGATTNVSCPPLAAAQALQSRYVSPQYNADKSFMTYKVAATLYSLDISSCTETLIAEASGSMTIGEVLVSDNNDILYEKVQWYIQSGHPKRSLTRVDYVTGVETEIISYAPKNTGVGSVDFSKNGTRVAFVATWVDLDTNPSSGFSNADESTELFLWENGTVTQLTDCSPATHEQYNDCIIVNPHFTESSGRYLTIQADYNPVTGVPHEPRYTIKSYKYDITEGKFL